MIYPKGTPVKIRDEWSELNGMVVVLFDDWDSENTDPDRGRATILLGVNQYVVKSGLDFVILERKEAA